MAQGKTHADTVAPQLAERAELDIWIFILIEGLVFSSYFVVYMLYRNGNPQGYLQAQRLLSQNFGAMNTLILLVSSLFAASALQSARRAEFAGARFKLVLTMLCGGVFVAAKLLEWLQKIAAGHTLDSGGFFWFYYFLTGIHVLHVGIGFIVLGVVLAKLRDPNEGTLAIVETGTTYWHMVDFLWVMIFALLYVMR
jgi:nitric oxide reductase NorE protein